MGTGSTGTVEAGGEGVEGAMVVVGRGTWVNLRMRGKGDATRTETHEEWYIVEYQPLRMAPRA